MKATHAFGGTLALLVLQGLTQAALAGSPAAQGTAEVRLLDLTARVPTAWASQPPSSSMRLAQFRVPGKPGSGDAELIVFYFGQGQGGSADANIARWQSQISDPGGRPVTPSVQRLKVDGMPATTVELTGTYTRSMGMGAPGTPAPDQTLLAAILETPKGSLFFQMHGPKATVAAHRAAFLTMVRGIKKT
jgi:hypothetical protein